MHITITLGSDPVPNYTTFLKAVDQALGPENAKLIIAYLESNGAIQNNTLDEKKVEEAMKSLFGEGALVFNELVMKISRFEASNNSQ